MSLHDPWWLILLPLIFLALPRRESRAHPWAQRVTMLPDTWRVRCARALPYLRLLLLALVILALARPQGIVREIKRQHQGVDLVVALDLSSSMLAEAIKSSAPRKNRLEMAKAVLTDLIRSRPDDRIGLVVFAARAYPAAPLTLDHAWLQAAVVRLQSGAIEDGTALGDAILASLNRLRGQPAAAILLITDGGNNAGVVAPLTAAAAAHALGVRIHAIGIGAPGPVAIPVANPLGGVFYRSIDADLDEGILREIAAMTGGHFFLADDQGSLTRVFREIDRLEKRAHQESVFFSYQEGFPFLLQAGLLLLLLELSMRATLLRGLP